MRVTSNSFTRLWLEHHGEILGAMEKVGRTGWYILGQAGQTFEADLAAYCDRVHAVGCGNGMDAIEISLRALGIGAGDKVLTTPLSAFATGLAIVRAGAEPVFCDVDENGLLDPLAAKAALLQHPEIRCIVPVHLYGHLADMERLASLAERVGVALIEDAAQAVGARRGPVRVGDLSRVSCLSFYPTKNLGAIGDGGAIVTDDIEIASRARSLRNYGQTSQYIHDELGLNSRLDEMQASLLGEVFLPRLERWTTKRREIARRYLSEINNRHVTLLPGPDLKGSVWHLFPVLVAPSRRQTFMAHLEAAGIQAGRHYPVLIPHQRALTDRGTCQVVGNLERAAHFAESEVSLPINPFLTDDEVAHVIATVDAWPG